MKRLFALLLVAVSSMFATSIQVVAVLGPSPDSASYAAFTTSVVTQLQSFGGADAGSGPTGFNQVSIISHGDMLGSDDYANFGASAFPSWRGSAPGSPAGEIGTYLYFTFRILAGVNDPDFALADVGVDITSTDGFQPGGFWADSYTYAAEDYRFDRVGFTPFRASGAGTLPVRELIYTGPGLSIDATNPVYAAGTDQGKLNNALASYMTLGNFAITAVITLGSTTGAATVSVTAIPEPGTFVISGGGLLMLGLFARRFRR